ncbi:hypothetical protein KDA23_06570 [Candidatus Saccharibacteria bacterium]|nr:hypothetical protein [Candidatus Saccharibacteria bacterium]
MANFVVHPRTQESVDQFAANPGQALMMSGLSGLGKGSLATALALRLLASDHADASLEPGILKISPLKGGIGIEVVRNLQHFMSLKTTTNKRITRVAIIEDSHVMSVEAQNALLKLLEEPPKDSVFILTAASEHALLPTIRSRVQHFAITKPTQDALIGYFEQAGHTNEAVVRALRMSGGLPGLMAALLEEDQGHPLQAAAQQARNVLSATVFERQCLVDQLAKERQLAIDTCAMLGQMASIALKSPTITPNQLKKWRQILAGALAAGEDLSRYVQPKLVLSRYLLSF